MTEIEQAGLRRIACEQGLVGVLSSSKEGYSNDELRNARNSVFQAYVGFALGGK